MVELPLKKPRPSPVPVIANHGDLYWRFQDAAFILGGLEHLVPEAEVGIARDVSREILNHQVEWIRGNFEDGLILLEPLRAWCSTMAFTLDGFPFVGPLPQEGFFVLAGLCGLGHSYALECAAWLYELIARGRNIIPGYFSSDRLESLGKYTGGNWRDLYEAWNH